MWNKIYIYINQIETRTEKAALVKLPNSSEYEGMFFWYPLSLIRKGSNSNLLCLSFNEDFEFDLFKTNKRGEKIGNTTISAEEVSKVYKSQTDQCDMY